MRVDAKTVETDSTRTLGKSGVCDPDQSKSSGHRWHTDLLKKPNQNKNQTKKTRLKKTLKKEEQLVAKVREHMYDSWPFQLKSQL